MINAIIRLIRLPNLIIVAVTQLLIRYFVILPFLQVNGFSLQLSGFWFFLLVLSTLLITAAGYTINDYFDTRTDRLNKPSRVVIDSKISRSAAINAHTIMNIIGVGLGIWLSFHIGIPGLSLIFFLAAGMLWFYSTNYKRQFLIGNLIVSLLTAMVPVLVILFEMPLLNKTYGPVMLRAGADFNYIFYWVAAFGFFAFLTNFIREIIKDAEDFQGDSAYGMNTIPILMGIKFTKWLIIGLVTVFNLILALVLTRFILFSGQKTDFLSAGYFLLTVGLPSLLIIFKLGFASGKKQFRHASLWMKIIMLAGLLYAVIVSYNVLHSTI